MIHAFINYQIYVKSLIEYTSLQIKGAKNTVAKVLTIWYLGQEFQILQIRICFEVLRKYLGSHPFGNATLEQALAQIEIEY